MVSEETNADSSVLDLETIFDPTTCVQKGLCPVTQLRHQGPNTFESHSLYFEQHGTGSTKILFIMGLNNTSFGWAPQVDYFGRKPEYSILVFDNRGVGHSGIPRGPYTTSGMAEDVIVLLDYVGWAGKRDFHVVGISLGGMIAQELASRIPERILSLTLCVTTPGGWLWNNIPPWKGAWTLLRLMTIPQPERKIPFILDMVFTKEWLDEKSTKDPAGRTNRVVQAEAYLHRMKYTSPQTLGGSLSQMAAGLTHHVTAERLRAISSSIAKVVIVTGDNDNLVDPQGSRRLKYHMPEAELVEWKGTGHAIHTQRTEMLEELLQRVFKEGQKSAERAD